MFAVVIQKITICKMYHYVKKSLYKYIDSGLLIVKNIDLKSKVKLKDVISKQLS